MPDTAYVDDLVAVGRRAGLAAVGVAGAEPFDGTRVVLERRRARGLAGGMQFTYRNPQRSTDPARALAGAASIVVGARAYRSAPAPADEAVGPVARVAAYAQRDNYADLRVGLGAIAAVLEGDGWRTRVLADDNAMVDRAAAVRAGIGWYGKSSNLLLPGRGSWFVLGGVVTDAPLPTADPLPDGCGSCERCIDGCPTGAIVAPGVVDARRCLAWLVQAEGDIPREHRVALGDRLYGCDDCQEVCPPNRREVRLQAGPAAAVPDGPAPRSTVPVLGLLESSDDELLARHGRWYIPRRDPRYLRRNALVVLGNSGDGDDPRVVDALHRHLAHPDPLLRAHAAWAARRLGRPDLVAGLADDPAPEVRDELAAPAPPVARARRRPLAVGSGS